MAKEKNKKGQGEGSIRQKDKNRWEGRYTFNGKQKSIYGDTEQDVKNQLKKIFAEIELQVYIEPTKYTVKEWLELWLKEYRAKQIKALTYESYERTIRLHIIPKLGNKLIREINNIDIQKHINSLGNTRTAELTKTVLSMSLAQAVRANLIPKNPAEYVIMGKRKKRDVSVLNADERHSFTKEVVSHRLGCAFLLLLSTGIRRGELLALKWPDIDFKNGFIVISKSFNRVKDFTEEVPIYKNVTGSTKSKKGQRIIPILPNMVKYLRKHKNQQLIEEAKAENYNKNNLVFCSKEGKCINPRNFTKYFYNFLEKSNLDKIRLHELRHTFATMGLEHGIDLKVMQEFLGHSTLNVTSEIYTHVLPNKKKQEINKLLNAF